MSLLEEREPSLSIGSGLAAFGGGIGFILTTPRMWLYALVPITVMVLVTILLSVLFIWGGFHVSGAVLGEPTGGWGRVGVWLLNAVMVLLALLVAGVVALVVAQPLSCFALEAIAHAQEESLTGKAPIKPSLLASLWASIRVVGTTVLVGGIVLGTLFAITFAFPPAAVVTAPLKFLVCAWLLAWDFLDYPMGLRGMGLWARLAWVRRNFDAFCAFGIAWAALVVVPGLVLLLLPMGVAGAARLVVEDERLNGEPGRVSARS
jgi:CysZ protein